MRLIPLSLAVLVAVSALVAQDAPAFGRQTDRLRRACAKMSSLTAVAAVTSVETTAPKGPMPFGEPARPPLVRLVIADGVLHARLGESDQIAIAARASIARRDDGPWALRKDRTHGGVPRSFVLDPQLLFRALTDLELTVVHAGVGEADGRPVEIYSVSLEPEVAGELTWAGALPPPTGLDFAFGMFGGAGAVELPKPKLPTDLAFAIDPATEQVVELRVQMDQRVLGAQGGAIQIRVGQGGVVQLDEPREVDEEQPDEALEYRDGLPMRKLNDDMARSTLTVTFREFGTARLPELGAHGRHLLGLPPIDPPVAEQPR